MAKNSNLRIWKNAIPLGEAWEFFAAHEERAALAEMPGFNETLNSEIVGAEGAAEIFSALTRGLEAQSARRDAVNALREKLLDRLFDGTLVAIAYREAPTRSSFPVHIDHEFFDEADADWEQNSATAFGRSFNRIHVYDQATLPANARPKLGRPGSAGAINAALDQITRENPKFCDLSRKDQCQKIRDYLGVSEIPGSGMSLKNLSKFILQRCPTRRVKS